MGPGVGMSSQAAADAPPIRATSVQETEWQGGYALQAVGKRSGLHLHEVQILTHVPRLHGGAQPRTVCMSAEDQPRMGEGHLLTGGDPALALAQGMWPGVLSPTRRERKQADYRRSASAGDRAFGWGSAGERRRPASYGRWSYELYGERAESQGFGELGQGATAPPDCPSGW
jgi:hypothetical protein